IALRLFGIPAVVVNAMAVEGQRRVAEQERLVRGDRSAPRAVGRGLFRAFPVSARGVTVDQILIFLDRDRAVGAQRMSNRYQNEWTAAASLLDDQRDHRAPVDAGADAERTMKAQPAAR